MTTLHDRATISKTATLLAESLGIKVIFAPGRCCTDGKTIWLPSVLQEKEDLLPVMRGALDHELAHVLYTDFSHWDRLKGKSHVHFLANTIEDFRIEKELKAEWLGARVHLEMLHEWALTEHPEEEITHPFVKICIDLWHRLDSDREYKTDATKQIFEEFEPEIDSVIDSGTTGEVIDLAEKIFGKVKEIAEQLTEKMEDKSGVPSDSEAGTTDDEESSDEDSPASPEDSRCRSSSESTSDDVDDSEPGDSDGTGDDSDDGSADASDSDAGTSDGPGLLDNISDEDAKALDHSKSLASTMKPEINPSGYHDGDTLIPPSTEDDLIVRPAVDDSHKESFGDAKKDLAGDLRRMISEFSYRLVSETRSKWKHGLDRGAIDPRTLHTVVTGKNHKIFRQRRAFRNDLKSTVITLLLDQSGSMRHDMPEVRQGVIAFGEVLHTIGIDFEVLGFTTGYATGGHTADRHTERTVPTTHLLFKEFTDQWAARGPSLFNLSGMSENCDHEALLWAGQRLLQQKASRRLLFVFTDGYPSFSGALCSFKSRRSDSNYLAEERLHDAIAELEAAHIETIGFGLGTTHVTKFYKRHIEIDDLSKLGDAVVAQLDSALGMAA